MKLHIVAAAALVSTLSFAGTASAQAATDEGSRPLGIRLEAGLMNGFNLVGDDTELGSSPHGDIRIGYDLDMGLTPLIGLGYRSNSQTVKVDGNETADNSVSAFTVALELRYYLAKHRRGLQPFVWGEFNTSFVSYDRKGATTDALDAMADEADHTELNLGFGAEYKFTRSFAVGGKWGLGFGFRPSESDDTETSNTTIGTSSSVYLAWRM